MSAFAAPSYAEAPPKRTGGRLCLDFINSVEWRGHARDRQERLTGYGELILWARAVGVLGTEAAARLAHEASLRSEAAGETVAAAIAVREAAARLLNDPVAGAPADLAIVNAMLARAPSRAAIAQGPGGLVWKAGMRAERLQEPLWPVLWDLADLLTSDAVSRVRMCADVRCGWLFLDNARGRRRRWCSMADCGNRAKARRHYARQKGESGQAD